MTRNEAAKLARDARMKNIPPLDIRFWSKVNRGNQNECWEWNAAQRKQGEGYGAFWFKGRHHPAPRIAYLLSTGVLVIDLQICHTCDNPSCCNPSHLFVGTNKDNNNDKVEKLRHAFGAKNGNALLNDETVREIRGLRPRYTLMELASMFGINYSTVSDVCRRKSWKHVI